MPRFKEYMFFRVNYVVYKTGEHENITMVHDVSYGLIGTSCIWDSALQENPSDSKLHVHLKCTSVSINPLVISAYWIIRYTLRTMHTRRRSREWIFKMVTPWCLLIQALIMCISCPDSSDFPHRKRNCKSHCSKHNIYCFQIPIVAMRSYCKKKSRLALYNQSRNPHIWLYYMEKVF